SRRVLSRSHTRTHTHTHTPLIYPLNHSTPVTHNKHTPRYTAYTSHTTDKHTLCNLPSEVYHPPPHKCEAELTNSIHCTHSVHTYTLTYTHTHTHTHTHTAPQTFSQYSHEPTLLTSHKPSQIHKQTLHLYSFTQLDTTAH